MRAALSAMKEVQIQDEIKLSRKEGQLSDARAQIMSHTLKEQLIAPATSTKDMETSTKELHQQISLPFDPTTHNQKCQRTERLQHDCGEDEAVTSAHCCPVTVSVSSSVNHISMQKDSEARSSAIDNVERTEKSKCIDPVDPMMQKQISADPGLEDSVPEKQDGDSLTAATTIISHSLHPSLQESHVAISPADVTKIASYTEGASSSTKTAVDIAIVR